MRDRFCLLLGVYFFVGFHFSIVEGAVPLQKAVLVIAGFNEHRGVIFVAKDMRFFEEQGIDMQNCSGTQRPTRGIRSGRQRSAVLRGFGNRRESGCDGRRFGSGIHRRTGQ